MLVKIGSYQLVHEKNKDRSAISMLNKIIDILDLLESEKDFIGVNSFKKEDLLFKIELFDKKTLSIFNNGSFEIETIEKDEKVLFILKTTSSNQIISNGWICMANRLNEIITEFNK